MTASMRFSGQPSAKASVDLPVDRNLSAEHAFDDVAEIGDFGGLGLSPSIRGRSSAFEFGEMSAMPFAGHVHLVERLHRRKPR